MDSDEGQENIKKQPVPAWCPCLVRRRRQGGESAARSPRHPRDRPRALPPRGRPGPGGGAAPAAGSGEEPGGEVWGQEGVGEVDGGAGARASGSVD